MNVLFVCTGNTCRSPMAEGILAAKNIPELHVLSRGLAADGSPVSQNAAAALQEIGIDISKHISHPLLREDLASADKILCLSPSHQAALAAAGVPEEKLFVLGDGIPDPFGGDLAVYRLCRDRIAAAIDTLAEQGFFSDLVVKPMEKKHLAPIAKLEKLCFSEPWSQEALLESYQHGTRFFTAEKKGVFAGYAGVSAILDEAYITNVAVLPDFRRCGVATALLQAVFDFCRQRDSAFVSLEVRASNHAAVALYEKAGFQTVGRRPDFYRAPREDALIMTKTFDMDKEQPHENSGH